MKSFEILTDEKQTRLIEYDVIKIGVKRSTQFVVFYFKSFHE